MMPHWADFVQTPFSQEIAQQTMNSTFPERGVGKVYLVGAGPGDPGLITVRGQECLKMADVVLYDALSNPQLLLAAEDAECICVGKHGQTPLWTQADINARLLELARQGRTVVRLKGGDPAVFARTAEELEVLSAAHIPFEVVPGITAALAAASYVGIPITHRQHASAVAFVTGQQQTLEVPQPMDWDALARFPGTLVLYMGVTTVDQWTSNLISAGKSPSTPAAIIRRCTWSDQSAVRCQLGEVAHMLHVGRRVRPPVIVIVGAVAALGESFDWFTMRPLHGCGVLVTRAAGQADELVSLLQELGADVYQQPVFEIARPSDLSSLDTAIDQLQAGQVHGITFSSSNSVEGLFQRCFQRAVDARILAGVCVASVGPATTARLRHYGLQADISPDALAGYSAAGLLSRLDASLSGQNWIVTTTNRSPESLANSLRERGAAVTEALCYQTRSIDEPRPEIAAAIEAGKIQFVTITSGYVAEASSHMLKNYRQQLQPLSLSQSITQRLAELGWPAAAQAQQHTSQALVESLLELLRP
jgi:uroporphyrinogen III methyltransferase / synthase